MFELLLERYSPRPALIPYTTLFRSPAHARLAGLGSRGLGCGGSHVDPSVWLVLSWRPGRRIDMTTTASRSEEHSSELQSRGQLVCSLLHGKKNRKYKQHEINHEDEQ